MAAKPEGRPRPEGRPGIRLEVEKEVYLPMRVMFQGLKGEMKEG